MPLRASHSALLNTAGASQVYSVDTKKLTIKDKLNGDRYSPLTTREHDKLLMILARHVFDSHEERKEARRREQIAQEQRWAERREAEAIMQAESAKRCPELEQRRAAEEAATHRRKLDLLRARITCEATGIDLEPLPAAHLSNSADGSRLCQASATTLLMHLRFELCYQCHPEWAC